MSARKMGLLGAAGLVVLAAFGTSGCFVTPRGRVYVPGVRVRPAVAVRPPVVYASPVVRVAPPPAPVVVRRSCPYGYYFQRGRYRWYAGRWVWIQGGCRVVPAHYRVRYRSRRCRYYPSQWVRVGAGYRRVRGGWRCY